MIARHDLVLGLCLSVSLCHCLYFLTSLPNLLILCVSLFFMPSLQLHLIFFSHWTCLPPFFLSFIHCLSPFTASALPSSFQASSVLPLCYSSSFSPMYAFFISQFVSLPQPIIIFLCSHPLSFPPPLSLSLPLPSSPCFYSSLPAPRVPRRETSRAVVPAEQLPCKAIQIEMFAENNMCVITA